MKVGIIGSGRIGSMVGTLLARAGYHVLFSSRHPDELADLIRQVGHNARKGTIAEAASFGDVVILSVPWTQVENALQAAGDLSGKLLIDTTNQYGAQGPAQLPGGISAAAFNQQRARGAKLVKAYNTLTAGFQAESAGRTGPNRVAMPYAGEDPEAKQMAAKLIEDSGFAPFDVGGWDMVKWMEPPRRRGAFYGEEWHLDTAAQLLQQIKAQSG